MTTILRQVKTFRGTTSEKLSEEINTWVNTTHCTPVSMTVNGGEGDFVAFVIYEPAPEKQRHLGLR